MIEAKTIRKAEYPVDDLFINRWSPRAMSGEAISRDELMSLFEAARWAPSSFNNQPWRFLYASRDTPEWNLFFDLLVEFNQSWTKNAAVLVVIVSKKNFDHNGQPSLTHSFDAGAAWASLALQGFKNGLVVHGMQGFDYDKAKTVLNIPDDYQVEAMAAIGKPGRKEDLPDALRERETPSSRKPLAEIVREGKFQK
ncbi:MAG TPA: nitroreductase family protein [bacterium]|nr:nitroreductase family protein [Candidatus Omnitrophota bacterium]HOJ59145.1 nitroreductase family protein [bacterium]HOL95957.1 nitroreductase family protein [bacterium]HPP00059.1 nitroreductase family protein [bacterium]HXK92188.1 nitroreductase family protein [bacterium]